MNRTFLTGFVRVSMDLLPGAVLSLWAAGPCWAPGWGQLSPAGRGTAMLIFVKDFFLLG